eukprot:gb/GECG01002159.1/.p1 GENE.gb/GECG01002159.1/~~gb/GECG01002159.1/.p1  ORF type:complete len:121 (+),score=8.27 gb/GECG01002159.1/:1-363(+)
MAFFWVFLNVLAAWMLLPREASGIVDGGFPSCLVLVVPEVLQVDHTSDVYGVCMSVHSAFVLRTQQPLLTMDSKVCWWDGSNTGSENCFVGCVSEYFIGDLGVGWESSLGQNGKSFSRFQ